MPNFLSHKITVWLVFISLLLIGCGGSAPITSPSNTPPPLPSPTIKTPASKLTILEWREDLETLTDSIKSIHPNPFKHITEAEFDQSVQALDAQIESLTENQIILELMTITALLQDGHTFITPMQDLTEFQIYPLLILPRNVQYTIAV